MGQHTLHKGCWLPRAAENNEGNISEVNVEDTMRKVRKDDNGRLYRHSQRIVEFNDME